jgi:hypothetical protein
MDISRINADIVMSQVDGGRVHPVKFLTKGEVEFFKKLFPNSVIEIERYYRRYNSAGQVQRENLTGKIINKKI